MAVALRGRKPVSAAAGFKRRLAAPLLLRANGAEPSPGDETSPTRLWMMALLFPIILFSSQAPAYLIDFAPTYLIGKAWPLLSLPLGVLCVIRRRLPGTTALLLLFIYGVGVTPILGMLTFPVGYAGMLQSAAKMAALLNVLSLFEMLVLLRPRPTELHRTLMALAAFTVVLMWLLWETVPLAVYQDTTSSSLLFFWDLERGPRIYAPMVFVFYAVFVITRDLWRRPTLGRVLLLVFVGVTMAVIYKQKLATVCVLAVMALSAFMSFPQRRGIAIAGGLVGASVLMFILASRDLSNVASSLGGSLETRVISGRIALDFMAESPWRWLFGVGSLPQHNGLNLSQLFRFHMFFVSDLGWLGIIFEYGVIGTILVLMVYAQATLTIWRAGRGTDSWRLGLFDYAIYLWSVQTVYSAVVAPGEIMTYLAVALYLATGVATRAAASARALR